MILSLAPQNFPDYELIDSGDFLKLERFGKFVTIRPEPQAVWDAEMKAKGKPMTEKSHKSKVKSAAQKSFGGRY